MIADTLQDPLPQQVWSLPLPVALSQLKLCLLEKQPIPPLAQTGEDAWTGPMGEMTVRFLLIYRTNPEMAAGACREC